jgi:Fe-S-cluster-containing hydrogenase component 2
MAKQLMVKPEKCIGCRTCELICSWNRGKDFNPQNSAVSIVDNEKALASVPLMCLQCEEAFCINACPAHSLSKDAGGLVKNDAAKCTGCKLCIKACPVKGISFNQASKKVFKCELCGGDPGCAKYCPQGCLVYTDEQDNPGRKKAMAFIIENLADVKKSRAEGAAK